MKRTLMLMALAAGSAPVWGAGWEYPLTPSLYSATFANYADGEKLSNKGAVGGKWQLPIPALSMARASSVGDRKGPAMEYATTSDIVFGVNDDAKGVAGAKALRIAAWVTAFETAFADLPKVGADGKFAFTVVAPPGGKRTFAGWSAKGWQKLHLASGREPEPQHAWYELSVWLAKGEGGVVRVQYRLLVDEASGVYEPFLNEDGSAWLEAGGASDDAYITEVAFRGEGAFDAMAGKELPATGVSVHFQ